MEDGLVPAAVQAAVGGNATVLILVVVEDGLVPIVVWFHSTTELSLNPCCSGRWSRTFSWNYVFYYLSWS